MSIKCYQQFLLAGNDFDGSEPDGTEVVEEDKDLVSYTGCTVGGRIDFPDKRYIYELVEVEAKFGSKIDFELIKTDGTNEIIILAGKSDSFYMSLKDTPVHLRVGKWVELRTADPTNAKRLEYLISRSGYDLDMASSS